MLLSPASCLVFLCNVSSGGRGGVGCVRQPLSHSLTQSSVRASMSVGRFGGYGWSLDRALSCGELVLGEFTVHCCWERGWG